MDNNKGFTITELLIATILGGMMAIILFSITIFLYGGVLRNEVRSELTVESQNILRGVVEDLRMSSGIKTTNSIPDANEPSGGWVTSNANTILIISYPALDTNNEFIVNTLTGEPYQNEYIYFAQETNLFKRILANPAAPGNSETTSCPKSLATLSCPEDRILSTNFKAMNFEFYDQDDIVTTDLLLARSIRLDIDMTRNVLGQDIDANNRIRVTMRNSL